MEEIISKFPHLPRQVIARYRPQEIDNDDLIQECWIACMQAMPAFRGDCKLRTYLWQVCKATVSRYDNDRSQADTRPLSDALNVVDTGQEQSLLAVLQHSERLSRIERECVSELINSDYKPHRAASRLGLTIGYYRQIILIALDDLGIIPDELKGSESMPRVNALAGKYAADDFEKLLRISILRHQLKHVTVAKSIGMAPGTFSNRVKNPDKWNLGELIGLAKALSADDVCEMVTEYIRTASKS